VSEPTKGASDRFDERAGVKPVTRPDSAIARDQRLPGSPASSDPEASLSATARSKENRDLSRKGALTSEDLVEIRDRAEFVQSFIRGDSDQSGGYLDELSTDVLRLLAALEVESHV
jgi:hypothetical protein